jgi:HNH endonuclease
MEEWRDIKGYEGIFQISSFGRVKSLPRKIWNGKGYFTSKEKILRLNHNPNGYATIQLWVCNKFVEKTIHRLVAEAFIPNPANLPVINHKNEIKNDNRVENLEWCTVKYNVNYGTAKERMTKKRSKPVIGVSLKNPSCIRFVSAAEAGRNGFCASHVIECCNNKRKTHKGYIWNWQ